MRERLRAGLRETPEPPRVLVPLPRQRKTHHNLLPHALAVPVSQHPLNRNELPLRPRLPVLVFNRPGHPREVPPLARM